MHLSIVNNAGLPHHKFAIHALQGALLYVCVSRGIVAKHAVHFAAQSMHQSIPTQMVSMRSGALSLPGTASQRRWHQRALVFTLSILWPKVFIYRFRRRWCRCALVCCLSHVPSPNADGINALWPHRLAPTQMVSTSYSRRFTKCLCFPQFCC